MAIVYRVRDSGRDSEVALEQLAAVEDADRRVNINALFKREFYMLSHPSIVRGASASQCSRPKIPSRSHLASGKSRPPEHTPTRAR
ncbi:MAG TPA: hypothetical protein VFG30_40370 [Polyangiales bacterium]|nr:hypothetical protein [Polyangiales bacterium]